jgi:hypothetical protein
MHLDRQQELPSVHFDSFEEQRLEPKHIRKQELRNHKLAQLGRGKLVLLRIRKPIRFRKPIRIRKLVLLRIRKPKLDPMGIRKPKPIRIRKAKRHSCCCHPSCNRTVCSTNRNLVCCSNQRCHSKDLIRSKLEPIRSKLLRELHNRKAKRHSHCRRSSCNQTAWSTNHNLFSCLHRIHHMMESIRSKKVLIRSKVLQELGNRKLILPSFHSRKKLRWHNHQHNHQSWPIRSS